MKGLGVSSIYVFGMDIMVRLRRGWGWLNESWLNSRPGRDHSTSVNRDISDSSLEKGGGLH